MKYRMKMHWAGALAALLVATGSALADSGGMAEIDYEAERDRIEARDASERKACKRLRGDAGSLCVLKAKGAARVALAELEARHDPTPETEQAAKEALARADYAVARAMCKQGRETARKACMTKAVDARDAAVRQSKVEKVRSMNAQRDAERRPQVETTDAAKYEAEKARCGISGADRDRCMVEAKRRFNKT